MLRGANFDIKTAIKNKHEKIVAFLILNTKKDLINIINNFLYDKIQQELHSNDTVEEIINNYGQYLSIQSLNEIMSEAINVGNKNATKIIVDHLIARNNTNKKMKFG